MEQRPPVVRLKEQEGIWDVEDVANYFQNNEWAHEEEKTCGIMQKKVDYIGI